MLICIITQLPAVPKLRGKFEYFNAPWTHQITVILWLEINCMCQKGRCSDIMRYLTRQWRNENLYSWNSVSNLNSGFFRKQFLSVIQWTTCIAVSTWQQGVISCTGCKNFWIFAGQLQVWNLFLKCVSSVVYLSSCVKKHIFHWTNFYGILNFPNFETQLRKFKSS